MFKLGTISLVLSVVVCSASAKWTNETLHDELGEIPIKSSSAKIEGIHPHKVDPVTKDSTHFLTQEHLNPIIVVPDFRNSQLEATIIKNKWSLPWCKNKWDYFQIWFKLKNFKPYLIDCWASAFRLHYDLKNRRTHNTPGVDVRPMNFGSISSVENSLAKLHGKVDYFGSLIESLVGLGYTRDQNLLSAPYDFRLAPHENDEFFYFFKKLIEASYTMNYKKPAILLCHGTGCYNVYYFLVNQPTAWKAHFVKGMVAIGAPWGGQFQGLYSYLDEDDLTMTKALPAIRYAERTFSMAAMQLPHPNFSGQDVLIQTVFRNYTSLDYRDIFAGLGYPNAYNMWVDSMKLLAEFKHPETDVFCISGLGFKTMESVHYKKAIDVSDEKSLKRKTKRRITYGNGDGRVNLKSSRRCLNWQNNYEHKFHYTEFKSKHDDLLIDVHPVSHILNIVTSLRHTVSV
ncbi:Phospholipase A2 group XV [Halotydeus destructor]|nr:Phospholipase A2 group XV [Halotydeus destructor]